MNELLNTDILGNSIRNYGIVLGIVLFVFFIRRFLSKTLASWLFKLVRHWSPQIAQHEFVELLLKPLEYFLLLTAFIMGSNHLVFPPELNIVLYNRHEDPYTLKMLVDLVIQITFTVTFFWIVLRLIDFVALILEKKADLTEDRTDNQFVIFFRDFFKALAMIIGAIFLINILFGKEIVEKLVAGLGIGAAALALAAKESIENLIGSFIIFSDKPFRVGDTVTSGSITGVVEKIGLRSTRIRTLDKTFVTVPNKQMVDSILDNLSLRTQQRVVLKLELAQDTPADKISIVVQSLRTYLDQHSDVEKGFAVSLLDFSKDAYILQIVYLTNILEGSTFLRMREDINLQAVKILENNNVRLVARPAV